MASKREITAGAKAMFEVARLYDQDGQRRPVPTHDDWPECSKELKDAYRRVMRVGLEAVEARASK